MILVTGASGNVGGEVVRRLAADGAPVRALARRPEALSPPDGVDLVAGDLSHPETLDKAFAGIEALFLLGGFDTMAEVLDRAGQAGLRRVVLLTSRCVISGRPDNAITGMWMESEAVLERSGLPATVLRPAGFQSNVLRWSDQLHAGDVVRAPWADVPIAAIDPADIAAVAAVALRSADYEGQALNLSGPQALSARQQLAVVAEVLDRPLRFEPQPEAEARTAMAEAMPEPFVDAQFRFFSGGEYDDSEVVDTVERVAGRPAGTLHAWAEAHRPELS
ncbi:MAG: NAD(P)H-binding protein [Pseudonocardiales bacterium]|nr:NAD(P)H-binding protein [Pseudonocardiales bacterium]